MQFGECGVTIPHFDSTIVDTIATLLANIVSQNQGLSVSPRLGDAHAVFGSPWMYEWARVEEYMSRLREWIVCGPESFVVATCLIKRLEAAHAIPPLTQRSAHRVFLTALLLGVKMMEDETLTNSDFAKVGCVTTKQLNRMELHALKALNFSLSISAEEFVDCLNELNFAKESLHNNNLKAAAAAARPSKEAKPRKEKSTTQTAFARKLSMFSLRGRRPSKGTATVAGPVVAVEPEPEVQVTDIPSAVRRTASVDADPIKKSSKNTSVFASHRRKSCAGEQCTTAATINVIQTTYKTKATPRLLLRQDSI